MKNNVLVGVSANAELVQVYDRMSPREKGLLNFLQASLCGTSANVARALFSLGQKSTLLALTGLEYGIEWDLFQSSLKNFPVTCHKLEILDKCNVSILPVDGLPDSKVFGFKGEIQTERVAKAILEIEKEEALWKVATGVRLDEVPLIKALFNSNVGYRSLNPKPELIKDQKKFIDSMNYTDLLIMNGEEFQLCKTADIVSLHEHGPKLIIITEAENGGFFSTQNEKTERFEPYSGFPGEVFRTGAGDWFHASFIAKCMELNKSIITLSLEEIRICISFAAKVAAKKVTMAGSANGPVRADFD